MPDDPIAEFEAELTAAMGTRTNAAPLIVAMIRKLSARLDALPVPRWSVGDEQPKPPPTTAGTAEPPTTMAEHCPVHGSSCAVRGDPSCRRARAAEPSPAEAAKCEACGGKGHVNYPTMRGDAVGAVVCCPDCNGTGQRPAGETGAGEDEEDLRGTIDNMERRYVATQQARAAEQAEAEKVSAALATSRALCDELRESEARLKAELAEARAECERNRKGCVRLCTVLVPSADCCAGESWVDAAERVAMSMRASLDTARRELAEAKGAYHESQGWVQTWRIRAEKAEAALANAERVFRRHCRPDMSWYAELRDALRAWDATSPDEPK